MEDEKWNDMKMIYQNYIGQRTVMNDYLNIVEQNKLLQEIKDEIVKKKYLPQFIQRPQFTTNIKSSNSTQANIKNITYSLSEEQTGQRSKFTSQFQQTILQSALEEVKNKCSQFTYQSVKQACENNKTGEYFSLQKIYEKIKKENQDLSAANLILHKQKSNILWELNLLKPKMKLIDDEKAKIKKQLETVMDKQQKIFKIEASLAFKEKISLQGRKRYERQRQSVLEAQKRLHEAIEVFEKLWKNIENKMSQTDCPNKCWRGQVMKKCKDKIMEQRDALKAQQTEIERQYQIMANLSQQFKKIFTNNESKSQINHKSFNF